MKKKDTLAVIFVMVYLILYGLFSASFLTQFPFVHSDEPWLAGLTRDMMESKSFGVTESFFDLKPRIPHALKLLYHGLQMIYIHFFGYNIKAVRLLSLTAALICLWILWLAGKELGGRKAGGALMVLVSLDLSFLCASHFARQEIILCASLLACLLLLLKCQGCPSLKQAFFLAAITGLSVGIHPNSFLCAVLCGFVMSGSLLLTQDETSLMKRLSPLFLYICVTGLTAALFVGASFRFDPGFIPDYFRYGEQEFELSSTASGRIQQFLYYFKSIFNQESGTYYIPDLRLELILLPLILVFLSLAWLVLRSSKDQESCLWRKHTQVLLLAMAGLAVATAVIGRYNQTSILFFLVLGWLAGLQLMLLFEGIGRGMAAAMAAAFLLWNGQKEILPCLNLPDYSFYLEQTKSLIPRDAMTIANLNAGFYFDPGVLRDYRNLPYLDNKQDLARYIEKNKIQYICLTDELDYIYENRPYYNVIYGNSAFIENLKAYCETECTAVGSFENLQYGARIIPLINNPEYGSVTVYRMGN